jgi:hypothetical protein
MNTDTHLLPKALKLYMEISLYPILATKIREQMRAAMFARGVVNEDYFESEVYKKALQSQKREGLKQPFTEESPHDWNERLDIIRDQLTDFYFAYNLPHSLFKQIVKESTPKLNFDDKRRLTFNPEITPWYYLFAKGVQYEKLPAEERPSIEHHLREIKAVLIKAMISGERNFIALARETFTMSDLEYIRSRRIGRGKIGGKAAGIFLAYSLLQQNLEAYGCDIETVKIPESYFIASDVYYEIRDLNESHHFMNQKYRTREEINNEFPAIYESHMQFKFPEYVTVKLRELLGKVGKSPLIFRSSSLLEDSFETSFAGKYDSFFLSNQGTIQENLEDAKNAIRKIYASVLSPDALIYRKQKNLIDVDERMAILIQKVEGQNFNGYFFPTLAGVGFSHNPFRWNSKIRREDGLLRLVCGLGTRAVDRVANDYPRMIALSHPKLRPERAVKDLKRYSQQLIDVINLERNSIETLPIKEIISGDYPSLRLIASQDAGDFLQPFIMQPKGADSSKFVFTFDQLLQKTPFAKTMRNIMTCLQIHYKIPVDIEYAVNITETWPEVKYEIALVQCRPLSEFETSSRRRIPKKVAQKHKLFTAHQQIPDGLIERVRYVVHVKEAYNELELPHQRLEVGRIIGRLNGKLEGENFILMGPGRWGSSNIHLGVKVSYSDIYNCRALIEIAMPNHDGTPEMAFGTHFFQDLVESKIYPLAIFPAEENNFLNWKMLKTAPNLLADISPKDADFQDVVTVIDLRAISNGRLLEVIMNAEQDSALAYLKKQ